MQSTVLCVALERSVEEMSCKSILAGRYFEASQGWALPVGVAVAAATRTNNIHQPQGRYQEASVTMDIRTHDTI